MKIVKSSIFTAEHDLQEAITSTEDFTFGYLIADQIAIWDPVWLNPDRTIPPRVKYDKRVTEALDAPIIRVPIDGSPIICNRGDICIFIVSKDRYSLWEVAVRDDLVKYLKLRYKLDTEIVGNDVLLAGKKFACTAIGYSTTNKYMAMFISMNAYTTPLINLICAEDGRRKGFAGLTEYKVCPRRLMTRILRFTRKWEARGL